MQLAALASFPLVSLRSLSRSTGACDGRIQQLRCLPHVMTSGCRYLAMQLRPLPLINLRMLRLGVLSLHLVRLLLCPAP